MDEVVEASGHACERSWWVVLVVVFLGFLGLGCVGLDYRG